MSSANFTEGTIDITLWEKGGVNIPKLLEKDKQYDIMGK